MAFIIYAGLPPTRWHSLMQESRPRWVRYFNQFVLVASIYLVIGLAFIVLNELGSFYVWDINIFDRFDNLFFYVVGSMTAVQLLASITCIAYIAFSGYVTDFKWGWSTLIFAALFFNFTPFMLLCFYYVCLKEPKIDA
jgi:hypothetical protein